MSISTSSSRSNALLVDRHNPSCGTGLATSDIAETHRRSSPCRRLHAPNGSRSWPATGRSLLRAHWASRFNYGQAGASGKYWLSGLLAGRVRNLQCSADEQAVHVTVPIGVSVAHPSTHSACDRPNGGSAAESAPPYQPTEEGVPCTRAPPGTQVAQPQRVRRATSSTRGPTRAPRCQLGKVGYIDLSRCSTEH